MRKGGGCCIWYDMWTWDVVNIRLQHVNSAFRKWTNKFISWITSSVTDERGGSLFSALSSLKLPVRKKYQLNNLSCFIFVLCDINLPLKSSQCFKNTTVIPPVKFQLKKYQLFLTKNFYISNYNLLKAYADDRKTKYKMQIW